MSCPEIGLHNSVKIWKDIQRYIPQNGNQNIQRNLKLIEEGIQKNKI